MSIDLVHQRDTENKCLQTANHASSSLDVIVPQMTPLCNNLRDMPQLVPSTHLDIPRAGAYVIL
jgi:hypothetical protein